MRGVNANLFEINQAKSRINKAKDNGVAPAQEDISLVATEKQNAYAIAQYTDVMTIEKFARHIATHGCVYSRADISAILYLAVDCMRELLLEGKKIRLGDLGDFSVSLTSKGAETADKFSAQNITGVNVNWECGSEFKNLIADAEFNLVASRKAQEAVLKAIKAGETTVDISTVGQQTTDNSQQTGPSGDNVPGGTTTDNSQNPSGGQQTTDNGQQSGPSGDNGQQTTDNSQTVTPGTGGDDGLV